MTGTELINAVGSVLNIGNPDATTKPTSTDIQKWLNMCQDMIARNVPSDDLQPLLKRVSNTLVLGSDVLRVVSVLIDDTYSAKWVPISMFDKLKAVAEDDSDKAIWTYAPSIKVVDTYWVAPEEEGMFSAMYEEYAQTFEVSTTTVLKRVRFRVRVQTPDPSGNTIYVRLYATTGSYGVDAKPTGAPLAQVEVSGAVLDQDAGWHDYWFDFDNEDAYSMSAGTYAVGIGFGAAGPSGTVHCAIDSDAAYGDMAILNEAVWNRMASYALMFEVDGESADGDVTIRVAPVSADENYDTILLLNPSDIGTSTRPNTTVPVVYDQTLVLYALAMAKVQDEEMPDAQYLFQILGTTLGHSNLPDEALQQGRS